MIFSVWELEVRIFLFVGKSTNNFESSIITGNDSSFDCGALIHFPFLGSNVQPWLGQRHESSHNSSTIQCRWGQSALYRIGVLSLFFDKM